MTKDNDKELIEALKECAANVLPTGSRMRLYGSRARGDARPDSDWDLHILIEGDEKLPLSAYDKYSWPFYETGLFGFGAEVNARVYSFAGWLKRRFLPFYHNVERDSILLFQN